MDDDDDQVVGANVRRLREISGLSQASLAEAVTRSGLSSIYPQTITKIEAGSRSLKLAEAVHIARALGVTADSLFELSPEVEIERGLVRYTQRLQQQQAETRHAFQRLWRLTETAKIALIRDGSRVPEKTAKALLAAIDTTRDMRALTEHLALSISMDVGGPNRRGWVSDDVLDEQEARRGQ